MNKWVILDGEEIMGRVHSNLQADMALLYAKTIFPDLENLRLKPWSHASKRERAIAKQVQLVRPEMCTRLWPNPAKTL